MKLQFVAPIALAVALLSTPARAGFHVMQIEQFIGAVNGDTSAQAIQLRMINPGQTFVSLSRVRAWDANGANPVLLVDMTTDVGNGATGDRILLASSSFNTIMASVSGYNKDFTLTNVVPASYLSGGKITFEQDNGTIYWSLAFGSYAGSNTGSTANDADGNFGAATVAPPIGSGFAQALKFNGAAAPSTTNLADYILSANPATVTNNARGSFVVVPEPGSVALLAALAIGTLAIVRRRS